MPTAVRRRLRQFRRGLGYTVAIALVLVALVLAVASRVLPLAESHPARIAAWLSERAGRPVRFDAVQTEWTRRGPLLQLENLRIGEGGQALAIGDTEMLVSIYAGLLPGTPMSELRLRGLDLTLEREADGRWHVRGLPGGEAPGVDPFEALESLGELQVIGGRLAVVAPGLGIDAHIPRIDLRLQVHEEQLNVGARAWPAPGAAPLDAVLVLDRATGDGRVWAGARRVDLAAWSPLLRLAGVAVDGGAGRAQAWAQLRGHRLAMVTVDAALRDVGLVAAAPHAAAPPARVDFATVEARARWKLIEGGWRLDAPRLRIGSGKAAHVLDGLLLAGGARRALVADRIDAGPLLAVAALSDRLSPPLRRWLRQADPGAVLSDVSVTGKRGGGLHARARIDDLRLRPVGDSPGLSGLSGVLQGDSEGFALRLDGSAPVVVDWPRGFGRAHALKLSGTIAGWRQGEAWTVATPALRLAGEGLGLQARGGLRWQGDGTRPRIDLAVDIDPTRLPVAKGFLLRHRMSDNLVDWLDAALVAGTLRDGRAVVSGDLDHWPFGDGNGRFEARARLEDATIRFQPGWPPVQQLDAELAFIADGFTVEGQGGIAGLGIDALQAGIDHYRDGRLQVRAQAAGDAGQLLQLLRDSPLRESHGETLDSLGAAGPARATFALTLPLHSGARMRFDGSVSLANARLADSRWDLRVDRVSGRAEYDRAGFSAPRLQVRYDGRPGTLSLHAGRGHVDEPANAFQARLTTVLGSDELLARAPQLGWLRPYLHGRSTWSAAVEVPRADAGTSARMFLRSDLVGTGLSLPAPLRKRAGEALATTVELPLPLDDGEIRVALGERLALRARSSPAGTGVRIALGRSVVERPPPAIGLVASGRAATLDAIDWIALVRGGDGQGDGGAGGRGGGSLPLRSIDVNAERLNLLGGVFADTRVQVAPAADGALAVHATGPALAGSLSIREGSGVQGRFQRMHWKPVGSGADAGSPDSARARPEAAAPAPADAAATGTATGTATATRTSAFDPASLPPLDLQVDDLRLVDAPLGRATLRTRPTAAGLRVEQLSSRIDGDDVARQAIDITGSWTGRGAAARTRLAVAIDSGNFGTLLEGLGFGGRVAGSSGNMRLDAGWPGSPADFGLASLQGQLELDMRDGRLLEVEPGAGRVLGLLSLAELPRRLALDFGDFFRKGFAFNTVNGQVHFADGVARSDDLSIDGPAAIIDIRGAADLRAETYDQTIEVRPKTGNLLTVAGALAAGPVGAALGAAANAVLKKPLGELAARTYRVTGPWENPDVDVISREPARPATAERQVEPAG